MGNVVIMLCWEVLTARNEQFFVEIRSIPRVSPIVIIHGNSVRVDLFIRVWEKILYKLGWRHIAFLVIKVCFAYWDVAQQRTSRPHGLNALSAYHARNK